MYGEKRVAEAKALLDSAPVVAATEVPAYLTAHLPICLLVWLLAALCFGSDDANKRAPA
jgi:hypothetical protein